MASAIAAPSAAAFSSLVSASAASSTCGRQATYRACPYSRALPARHNGLSAMQLPSTKMHSQKFRPVAPCRAKVVAEAKSGARVQDPCAEGVTGVVSDKTWDELVKSSKVPVLVDFWAPWCGPCRMIAPLIDELAKDYKGKLLCLKLNTDESPSIATEHGIRSIPTVMIFKGGKKLDTVIGAVPMTTLTTTVEKFLE
ncbi:hypothetical protein KFL_002370110 [Klebsormidium nitens]|uniref:Thioredoxin domain-containing protein n=1 Tax=Klebsormidium nitens TaxID=105231 RepID=A0A1Y1I9T3_KLENI|nr:hypothetical protein KFL_002370110 [Klebsormidium nitens]|eukprot:GAQ85477.1 hypothetical protein KFL_002370110 [Klebsormidium nitens]